MLFTLTWTLQCPYIDLFIQKNQQASVVTNHYGQILNQSRIHRIEKSDQKKLCVSTALRVAAAVAVREL